MKSLHKLLKEYRCTIGNKKLGKDTLIFNMSSATECSAKDVCKHRKRCYALKAERLYPRVKTFRDLQAVRWLLTPAKEIAAGIIEIIEKVKTMKTRPDIKFIRINESGDFISSECIQKLREITDILWEYDPNIQFYGYTARKDLSEHLHKLYLPNCCINTSNFDCTYGNSIKVVKDFEIEPLLPAFKCYRNCRSCDLCKYDRGIKIQFKLH